MTPYSVLTARVRQALHDLERVVARAEELARKAEQSGDDGYLDGVALNLHGFYAGVERIFEDIARTLDESVPSGSDWHRDLLLQMSATIIDGRPAVISQAARYCLDEYRGFRHVVRNVYAFNLRSSRLRELTHDLSACYALLSDDLNTFMAFLDQLARAADSDPQS